MFCSMFSYATYLCSVLNAEQFKILNNENNENIHRNYCRSTRC